MTPSKTLYAIILGTIIMIVPLAIDLYLPAFPGMAASFGTSIDAIEATVAVFLAGFALGQLTMGPVSDVFGRRIVLISGLVLFIVSSALIACTDSLELLYVLRFLQAVGGGGTVAVFPAVRDRFNDHDSGVVISYIMAVVLIAPVIAPTLGGYLLLITPWQTLFWVIAAFGAVALALTVVFVRDPVRERTSLSVGTATAGFARVLSEPRILMALLAGGFAFGGLFAFLSGAPFVYISYHGVAVEHFGYLIAMNAIATIGMNIVNGSLLSRTAPVAKVYAGTAIMLLSSFVLLLSAQLELGLIPTVVLVIVFFTGLALTETNAIIVALSEMPAENGSISALSGALQFGIGALASLMVSVVESTHPVSMIAIMLASAAAAFLCAFFLKRAHSGPGSRHIAQTADNARCSA